MQRIDRTGQRFGKLLVLGLAETKRVGSDGRIKVFWNCRCDCGTELAVVSGNLGNGHTESCGCVAASKAGDRTRTHGLAGTRVYIIWQRMKDRCSKPDDESYQYYGARGVKVCEKWSDSFEAFFADMGQPPSSKHSIEREDTNGNYEPGNCRWATSTEQGRNRRNNLRLTIDGETRCAAEWAEARGISPFTIYTRIRRGSTHFEAVFGFGG
jgi:hypothetical protein